MKDGALQILADAKLPGSTLLLALTGWMDGGDVSTGTVRQVMGRREVGRIATIDPDDFYIYNFPGSMEISALFRELLTRLPDLELAGPVERLPSNFISGPKHLPVQYTPARHATS